MVERVRMREVSPVVSVMGKLIANNKAEVSFPYDATVSDVYVNVGSRVLVGEPLLRLSDDTINTDLNLSQARQNELEALIEKNTTLLRSRESLLEEGKIERSEIERLEKEISLNEKEVERVKAEISRLNYVLDHSVINSTANGIIVKKNVNTGAKITPGEPLFVISDADPILVSLALDAKQSEDITVGTPLKVIVSELPNKTYTARVSFISPELHRVGKSFDVLAAIPNEDLILKAGMRASTEFESDILKHTFLIPRSAVFSISTKPYVYKVSKGTAHKTPIIIESIEGGDVEVISGLTRGDLVIVKGGDDLFDGADVNIWR